MKQAGMIDRIKCAFDIKLQEARYGPVAPGDVRGVDD
jgi:hypothetical protein